MCWKQKPCAFYSGTFMSTRLTSRYSSPEYSWHFSVVVNMSGLDNLLLSPSYVKGKLQKKAVPKCVSENGLRGRKGAWQESRCRNSIWQLTARGTGTEMRKRTVSMSCSANNTAPCLNIMFDLILTAIRRRGWSLCTDEYEWVGRSPQQWPKTHGDEHMKETNV